MRKATAGFAIIFISFIAISQGKQDDIVSSLVDGPQQQRNTTCLCTGDDLCDLNTSTCRLTDPDHACYQTWAKDWYDETIRMTAGCLYNDFFFTQILCNVNHSTLYIICCSDKDYCNDRDAYAGEIRSRLSGKGRETESKTIIERPQKRKLKLILCITLPLAFLLMGLLLVYLKRQKNSNKTDEQKERNLLCSWWKRSLTKSTKTDDIPSEVSSTDECGERLLFPRTLAHQIDLGEKIGVGGYGCVHRAKWCQRQEIIAVKIFRSSEEASWLREIEIYETFGLNHENILRYYGSDTIDNSQQIELWIVTEYHENGSVYDYLTKNTITIPILMKMIVGITRGLAHLHLAVDTKNGRFGLAHRDMKTKNILVKQDLSCCIADFGLAVREKRVRRYASSAKNDAEEEEQPSVTDIIAKPRAGTTRYMAPELLNGTLNDYSFESYKALDLYALGLIFWEMLRRCRSTAEVNDTEEYKLAYQDVLPSDPTYEQMHDYVCVRNTRPSKSLRWDDQPVFKSIWYLCQELWSENPACRQSSSYVMTQLLKLSPVSEHEPVSSNLDRAYQGPYTI